MVELRRCVFDGEVDIWEEFLRTIEGVVLVKGSKDKVIQAPSSSGRYSCKFFRSKIARVGSDFGQVGSTVGYNNSIESQELCLAASDVQTSQIRSSGCGGKCLSHLWQRGRDKFAPIFALLQGLQVIVQIDGFVGQDICVM